MPFVLPLRASQQAVLTADRVSPQFRATQIRKRVAALCVCLAQKHNVRPSKQEQDRIEQRLHRDLPPASANLCKIEFQLRLETLVRKIEDDLVLVRCCCCFASLLLLSSFQNLCRHDIIIRTQLAREAGLSPAISNRSGEATPNKSAQRLDALEALLRLLGGRVVVVPYSSSGAAAAV